MSGIGDPGQHAQQHVVEDHEPEQQQVQGRSMLGYLVRETDLNQKIVKVSLCDMVIIDEVYIQVIRHKCCPTKLSLR